MKYLTTTITGREKSDSYLLYCVHEDITCSQHRYVNLRAEGRPSSLDMWDFQHTLSLASDVLRLEFSYCLYKQDIYKSI